MAAQLQLSRDTHVYAEKDGYFWELPILDGFSFSQSTATTEVAVNEMADLSGVSRRGRKMFTDAFEPAEWNLQMYARPHQISSGNIAHTTDEVLWANFLNAGAYTHGAGATRTWANGLVKTTTATPSTVTMDFDDTNVSALGTFNLYFVLGACGTAPASYLAGPGNPQTIYKISKAVCNSVTMDFDIDGILTLDWSGLGSLITEEANMPTGWDSNIISDGIAHSNDNFIRNRLSTLAITTAGGSAPYSATSYELTLTGGSISFENNLTYLTPEELCVVNQPLGNVTGTRNISGSFTCYLNAGTNANSAGTSGDLFDDLASATTIVNNSTDLVFSIGGASNPKLVIDIPTAHLEIPTHQIEDIIGLEVNFHALPSSLDQTNEATLVYHNA
jgi:hypothetical protein